MGGLEVEERKRKLGSLHETTEGSRLHKLPTTPPANVEVVRNAYLGKMQFLGKTTPEIH